MSTYILQNLLQVPDSREDGVKLLGFTKEVPIKVVQCDKGSIFSLRSIKLNR